MAEFTDGMGRQELTDDADPATVSADGVEVAPESANWTPR
jgi:hypothetical protein